MEILQRNKSEVQSVGYLGRQMARHEVLWSCKCPTARDRWHVKSCPYSTMLPFVHFFHPIILPSCLPFFPSSTSFIHPLPCLFTVLQYIYSINSFLIHPSFHSLHLSISFIHFDSPLPSNRASAFV